MIKQIGFQSLGECPAVPVGDCGSVLAAIIVLSGRKDGVLLCFSDQVVQVEVAVSACRGCFDGGNICYRRQTGKRGSSQSSSLAEVVVVSPVHPLEPEWGKVSMERDNLIILHLHDFLGTHQGNRTLRSVRCWFFVRRARW